MPAALPPVFPVFSFNVLVAQPAGKALILPRLGVSLPARRYNVWLSPVVGDVPLFTFQTRNQHVAGQTLVVQAVPVALAIGSYDVYFFPRVAIEGGGGYGVLAETGGYVVLEPAM